jgi:hypothetical protein
MTGPRRSRRALASALLLCALWVSVGHGAPAFVPPRYTRAQMEAALGDAPPFRFVYGTRDPARTALLRARAVQVARRMFDGDSMQVVADRDVSDSLFASGPMFLFGGPGENRWTERVAPALPVRFEASGFRWQGRLYDRPDESLQLSFPNPLAPRRFLLLLAANSSAAYGRRGGWWGEDDWRITRAGEVVRSGRFAQEGGRAWRYDPALDRDREAERARYERELRPVAARALRVRAPQDLTAAPAIAQAADALLARMDGYGWTAPVGGTPPTLVLYRSLEEKGRQCRDTRAEHLSGDAVAHAARPAGRVALDLWSVAAMRLRQSGASEDSRFLVPEAVRFAERFEGETFDEAVARLHDGGVLPSAEAAATRDDDWRSPLVWIPARALLVEAVLTVTPPETRHATALELLRRDPPGTLDSLARRVGLRAATIAQAYRTRAMHRARIGARRRLTRAITPWRPADGFQRGVCVSHEGGLEQGYLSAECARQLTAIREAGAGWVSLTPFAWLPDPHQPGIASSIDGGPDGESDESLCEAAARARARGLRVWLKPHVWTRGWAGDLSFTPAGWQRFFDRYEALALHWALLADREGLDGLFVGHELASSTAADPTRWRRLIGRVRQVYGGLVSYGANWDEAERIPFWDALDVIGVSFYTPLAEHPTRDPAVLRAGAVRALAGLERLARRTGRPVLLAEVGYPPSPDAALRPWDGGRGAEDPAMQRECLAAAVAAMEPCEWLAGAFFWKWGSSARTGDDPYDPRGRPAGKVVTDALRFWQGRPVRVPFVRGDATPSPGGSR